MSLIHISASIYFCFRPLDKVHSLYGEEEPVPNGFIVNQEGSCLTESDP